MKAKPKYIVTNRGKGTPWKVGAVIERCTAFNKAGNAVFTVQGMCAVWAHQSEVAELTKKPRKKS